MILVINKLIKGTFKKTLQKVLILSHSNVTKQERS